MKTYYIVSLNNGYFVRVYCQPTAEELTDVLNLISLKYSPNMIRHIYFTTFEDQPFVSEMLDRYPIEIRKTKKSFRVYRLKFDTDKEFIEEILMHFKIQRLIEFGLDSGIEIGGHGPEGFQLDFFDGTTSDEELDEFQELLDALSEEETEYLLKLLFPEPKKASKEPAHSLTLQERRIEAFTSSSSREEYEAKLKEIDKLK